ncbi:MAG: uracil-DNA glycosylase [Pseudomonadota bacterium]
MTRKTHDPKRRADYLKALELDPLWTVNPEGPLAEWERQSKAADPQAGAPAPAKPAAAPGAVDLAAAEAASKPDAPDRAGMIARMNWETLEATVARCCACPLYQTRTQTVFGVGDRHAEWLFVGEAPGAEEDKRGEPFVGRAGKLLDAMLQAVDLKRGDNVYIANVLKSRPPNNRDPLGYEVQQCEPYLKRQVALIKPRIIVALGRFAVQSLLHATTSLGQLRGRPHTYEGIPLIVTYHPAYLLRSPLDKRKALEDLRLAQRVFAGLKKDAAG